MLGCIRVSRLVARDLTEMSVLHFTAEAFTATIIQKTIVSGRFIIVKRFGNSQQCHHQWQTQIPVNNSWLRSDFLIKYLGRISDMKHGLLLYGKKIFHAFGCQRVVVDALASKAGYRWFRYYIMNCNVGEVRPGSQWDR